MATLPNSAQKVIFFSGNLLANFECDIQFHIYRNNQPLDIRELGFQLRATNLGGVPTNELLDTVVYGTSHHILRLLKATPAAAKMPLVGGVSTAVYILWLSRAGEAGRKLLAHTTMTIDPTPKDVAIYSTGTLDAEPFRIDLDGDPETISGGLEDFSLEYDQLASDIFAMQGIVNTLNNSQALFLSVATFSDLQELELPTTKTFVIVDAAQELDDATYPAGQYLLMPNGRISYTLTGDVYRQATVEP